MRPSARGALWFSALAVVAALGCGSDSRDYGADGGGGASSGGSVSYESGGAPPRTGGASPGGAPSAGGEPGGDAPTGGGATGGVTASGGGGGGSLDPEAIITVTPARVGLVTELSGTASDEGGAPIVAYEWLVVSGPEGSERVGALGDAPTAALRADLEGSYVIRLTVTNADGASSTVERTVAVTALDVPFIVMRGDSDSFSRTPAVVRSDGRGRRLLGCELTAAGASGDYAWADQYELYGQVFADTHVAAAPGTSTVVYSRPVAQADVSLTAEELFVARPTSSCDGEEPVALGAAYTPALTPDGERLALFSQRPDNFDVAAPDLSGGNEYAIVTLASDGGQARVVRLPGVDELAMEYQAPVAWLPDGRLGWRTGGASQALRVYAAPDEAGAGNDDDRRALLLECPSSHGVLDWIFQLAIGPHGLVLSSRNPAESAGGQYYPRRIHVLTAAEDGTYACDTDAPSARLVVSAASGQSVGDFALAPDGATLAWIRRVAAGRHELWTLDLSDAESTPQALVAEDGVEVSSPRWVSDGLQLVWLEVEPASATEEGTGGSVTVSYAAASRLVIGSPDGSFERTLASEASTPSPGELPTEVSTLVTGTNGCAVAPRRDWGARGSLFGAAAWAMVLAARLLRRRSR